MADEEFEDDLDLETPEKSGNAKLLIIFGLLFVISNGIWGAVIFMKEPAAPNPEAVAKAEEAKKEETKDGKLEDPLNKPGPIVALEPFVVNLNESAGGHYLRTTVQIEIDKEESREHVDKRIVMLRDNFLTVLSSKQLDELQSAEDKTKLRTELLATAREVLSKRSVHAVYFTEFLTQ